MEVITATCVLLAGSEPDDVACADLLDGAPSRCTRPAPKMATSVRADACATLSARLTVAPETRADALVAAFAWSGLVKRSVLVGTSVLIGGGPPQRPGPS
jgi:hypothetical protein